MGQRTRTQMFGGSAGPQGILSSVSRSSARDHLTLQTIHVTRLDILFGKVAFLLGVAGVKELGSRLLVLGLSYEFIPCQLPFISSYGPAELAELRA